MIVALSERDNGIGFEGKMPWHLTDDLKEFKRITMGSTIVMGRKTFESIGKPLPGRENIVVTKSKEWKYPGVTICNDLNSLFTLPFKTEEIFIIGGAEIYKQTLNDVENLYITMVKGEFTSDTFFPEVPPDFYETKRSELKENNGIQFFFKKLVRENSKTKCQHCQGSGHNYLLAGISGKQFKQSCTSCQGRGIVISG